MAVASPSRLGFVHKITSATPSWPSRSKKRPHAELLGTDPVDRAQGAPEHVVGAVELTGPLDGDDVARVLDDTDDRWRHGARPSRSCTAATRRR